MIFKLTALFFLLTASCVYAAPAPLILTDFSGNHFDLAQKRGKVVLLSFWASWCKPCRAEMPMLEALYERYHAQGVEVLGLSLDKGSGVDKARSIAQTISYPNALVYEAEINGFLTPSVLPYLYIIDKNGETAHIMSPETDSVSEESIMAKVTPLLNAP